MKMIGKAVTIACVAFGLSLAVQASYGFVKIQELSPAERAWNEEVSRIDDACAELAATVTTGIGEVNLDQVTTCAKKATVAVCKDTIEYIQRFKKAVPDGLVCSGPEHLRPPD